MAPCPGRVVAPAAARLPKVTGLDGRDDGDDDKDDPAPVDQTALGCMMGIGEAVTFFAFWFSASLVAAAEGYRGPGAKEDASPPLPAARGLPLLAFKPRLPPTPGGIKNDMLEGVDIKLEGELHFRGRF